MKKGRVIFTAIVMVLIVAGFIFGKVFNDLKKEKQIKQDIKEIVRAVETDVTEEEINELLEKRHNKKGNYGEVEDALKKYYKDLYIYLKNIKFLIDEDNFNLYLSSKNIEEDGQAFTKSMNNLKTTKDQLNDKYKEFNNQVNDESTKASYIISSKIDKYYKNLYLEFINENTPTDLINNIEYKYKKTLERIDLYNEVFVFLSTNSEHWQLVDSIITFDDALLYEKYKEITDKLDAVTEELSSNKTETSEN